MNSISHFVSALPVSLSPQEKAIAWVVTVVATLALAIFVAVRKRKSPPVYQFNEHEKKTFKFLLGEKTVITQLPRHNDPSFKISRVTHPLMQGVKRDGTPYFLIKVHVKPSENAQAIKEHFGNDLFQKVHKESKIENVIIFKKSPRGPWIQDALSSIIRPIFFDQNFTYETGKIVGNNTPVATAIMEIRNLVLSSREGCDRNGILWHLNLSP